MPERGDGGGGSDASASWPAVASRRVPTRTKLPDRAGPGAATSPPPAVVPGNVWTAIDVEDVGALRALETVSVVVSGPDREGHVALTVAALTEQTYPRSMMEVIVEAGSDDGRDTPPVTEDDVAVKRSPAGAAIAMAEGAVVLFVPAGSVLDRELVEAHMRWHHAVSDAVSVGMARRLDAAGLAPEEVREAVRSDNVEELLRPRIATEDPEAAALEAFLERTHGLTERRPDLFRVAARGTVAGRSELLRAAGKAAAVRDHRLARLDLAYRLDCAGGLFVPERGALSYGAYPEPWIGMPDAEGGITEEAAPVARADPHAASVIPVRGFRQRGTGRVFARPTMVVNVSGGRREAAEVLEAVDAVLRGHLSDLVVRVQLSAGHPERDVVEAACAADPRVEVAESSSEAAETSTAGRPDVPYQATVPADALVGDETFDAIHGLMSAEGLGALHLTVPARVDGLPLARSRLAGRLLSRDTVDVVATGPLARARRVAAHEGETEGKVLARLFGVRRMDGRGLGIHRRVASSEPDPVLDGALGPASDLAHERAEHLRYRAKAATSQGRLDRQAQRLFRERFRSGHERTRAERLEARLARVDPRYWVRWKARRVVRRVAAQPRRLARRAGALREPLYRLKRAATARAGRRPE